MKTSTRVGTCGFAESHGNTFKDFVIVEVQQTFYRPPRVATVERWREEAGDGFIFTIKAWQLLTHEATSPTYRRLREPAWSKNSCGLLIESFEQGAEPFPASNEHLNWILSLLPLTSSVPRECARWQLP